MSIFNSVYEGIVWGSYYLVEFLANIFVIIYISHRMGWVGGTPRYKVEAQEPPVSNVQQASGLVAGVTDLLKTAKGAWTEVATTQPGVPQQPTNPHQPVYLQQKK